MPWLCWRLVECYVLTAHQDRSDQIVHRLSSVPCIALQDDEPFTSSPADDFPAEVVEMLDMLEAGGTLPPEEYSREPEEGSAFVARMDKLVARYEAQFLKKSQQQVRFCRHPPGKQKIKCMACCHPG